MVAVIAANADIVEEVELGRTLLVQGHLETAQRVLLKVCQAQPECAEAFRTLALVLSQRGDERRSRPLIEYADELDAQRSGPAPAAEDVFSDAQTQQTRLPTRHELRPGGGPSPSTVSAVPSDAVPPATQAAPVMPAAASPNLVGMVPPPAALPAPSQPSLPLQSKNRLARTAFVAVLCAGLAAGAAVTINYYRGTKTSQPNPCDELDRALASGSLDVLLRARDGARLALEPESADPQGLVRLGLVNAFLAHDYALDARKDAEDALSRATATTDSNKQLIALAATARALLSLATGDRARAREQADAALAAALPDPPVYALLVSAEIQALAGDGAGAARDLDRAMAGAADNAPVVIAWAEARLDSGDPVGARRALQALLEKNPGNSRARLLLADAECALGETAWVKNVELACQGDAKLSRSVRGRCAIESAVQSRLEGDRAGAIRKAKAAAQTTEDSWELARLSLLLAVLGEVDSADEVFTRARKGPEPATDALKWADLAIRMGRSENGQMLPKADHPAGPDRDLTALRAGYAKAGVPGLTDALKTLPPGVLDIDGDLRAFAALAREGALTKTEVPTLEKRGEKGNPIASYVLGVWAARDKDYKLAARRLEKALSLHGDACQAATLYLDVVGHTGRGMQPNKPALRALRGRNAKCPLPEL